MPPLIRPNDVTPAFDDREKAECLADSLESQCAPSTQSVDSVHLAAVDEEVERRSSLPPADRLRPVTLPEVEILIKELEPKKSPGADGISNRVLKALPVHLVCLLVTIFNAAIVHCIFPDAWKSADVIGIHKPSKPRSNPSSYRPISLLKALGKLYERLLLARLLEFVSSRCILINEQFGFRAEHSCVHQVHRITEHILSNLNRNPARPTGAVFFDIAKAFDKVWHNGLVFKLFTLGVPDRLVLILRDFLSNRSFRYRVEGTRSSSRPLRAGVPQGSPLSPLLFSLYVNDIPRSPTVQTALYADDTALYYSSRSPEDMLGTLQSHVDSLSQWFRKWRVEVNPEKSAAVLFRRGSPRSANLRARWRRPLTFHGQPIPWVDHVKYLGVTLDSKLTFRRHIREVRNRAFFVLGRLHPMLCKRSKLSLRSKVTLYKTCIRPIMAYASPVFAHAAKSHINCLQVIQNRFLRKAVGAPWYIRNVDLHSDLRLESIRYHFKEASERFFEKASIHPNELVQAAVAYSPEPVARRSHRRPRHVLRDPVDPITHLTMNMFGDTHQEEPTYNFRHHRLRRRRRGPVMRPR